MTRMSDRVKKLVCMYHDEQGYSTTQVSRLLMSNHGLNFTRFAVLAYLKRRARPAKKRIGPQKVLDIHFEALQLWLQENSEQTARVLQKRFQEVFSLEISTTKVKQKETWVDKDKKNVWAANKWEKSCFESSVVP